DRLVARFGPDWRVLLAHLVLFGLIYPCKRDLVPERIMRELLARLEAEIGQPADDPACYGWLLSQTQYVNDLEQLGMPDGRENRRKIIHRETRQKSAA